MAAGKPLHDLAEDLLCSICLDLFKEAVMLECGHSFCKSCVNKAWDTEKNPSCPECREVFPSKKYTVNRQLCKVVESSQRSCQYEKEEIPNQDQKSHYLLGSHECTEHKEALKVFCQDDGCPVCVICMISSTHKGHTFIPILEAASMFQDEAQSLEQHITSEFAKLRQFLQDKEQQLIQQLKEEAAGILEKMTDNLEKIEEMNKAVQKHKSNIESTLQQEDSVLLLKGITDEIKSVMKRLEEEEEVEEEVDEEEVEEEEEEDEEEEEIEQENDQEVEMVEEKPKKERKGVFNGELVSDSLSLGVYRGPLQYSIWKEMLSVINPEQTINIIRHLCDTEVTEPAEARFECEISVHSVKPPKWSLNGELLQACRDVEIDQDGTVHSLVFKKTHCNVTGSVQFGIGKASLARFTVNGLSHLTLDPKTAHRRLTLSEDLTSVSGNGVKLRLSYNPKRYDSHASVLASQGFTSGRHYWEVEVGCKTQWELGVTKESSNRKGKVEMKPEDGYWIIHLFDKMYWSMALSVPHRIVKTQKVGVYLDYERGQVSFYNADNMSHIYTFTDTFTERLYPYFWVGSPQPLSPFQRQ